MTKEIADKIEEGLQEALTFAKLQAENKRLREVLQKALPHLEGNARFLRDIQAHAGKVVEAFNALDYARAAIEEAKQP